MGVDVLHQSLGADRLGKKGIFSFDRGEHHGSMIIINTKTLEIDLFPRHVRR